MKLAITSGSLDIRLEGWEKVWALRGSFQVPMDAITEITSGQPGSKPAEYWTGLRVPAPSFLDCSRPGPTTRPEGGSSGTSGLATRIWSFMPMAADTGALS